MASSTYRPPAGAERVAANERVAERIRRAGRFMQENAAEIAGDCFSPAPVLDGGIRISIEIRADCMPVVTVSKDYGVV